jgi:hypothetical protein
MAKVLDELKELNRKLTSLLADPQPGLATWSLALGKVLHDMGKFSASMPANFEHRFHELAETYRRQEVTEELVRSFVWETFKAYASTLDEG